MSRRPGGAEAPHAPGRAAGTRDAILTLNAGSSSLKFALFHEAAEPPLLRGVIDLAADPPDLAVSGPEAPRLAGLSPPPGGIDRQIGFLLGPVLAALPEVRLRAAGHRIVHGGAEFAAPARLGRDTLARLEAFVPLAPEHQPHNLAAVRMVAEAFPDLPQVGCFDTAFHATLSEPAQRFPIPRALHEAGLRRYGFHGLSYQHVAACLPGLLGPAADGRVVAAHLGSGASLCAMAGRRSVATTMGLTALDGLMMGTRSGSLDPGLVLRLLRAPGATADSVEEILGRRSGLLGVSALSADLRVLETCGTPEAEEAMALFALLAARGIAAFTADLGGLDALVFTGGIGENSGAMRARICRLLAHLGVALDPRRNAAGGPTVSAPDSRVPVLVVRADEEGVIARETAALLARDRPPG